MARVCGRRRALEGAALVLRQPTFRNETWHLALSNQTSSRKPDGVSDAERNHFHRRNGAGLFTKPGSSTSRTQIPQPGVYGMLKAGRRKGAAWKGAQEVPRHVQEAVHANVTPLSRPLHSTR